MLSVPVLVAAILAVCKLYFSYKRWLDFVIFRSFVLVWLASLSVSSACRLWRVNFCFSVSSVGFFLCIDVVDLEGVVLFGVVFHLIVSVSSTFSKRSAGSGIS